MRSAKRKELFCSGSHRPSLLLDNGMSVIEGLRAIATAERDSAASRNRTRRTTDRKLRIDITIDWITLRIVFQRSAPAISEKGTLELVEIFARGEWPIKPAGAKTLLRLALSKNAGNAECVFGAQ